MLTLINSASELDISQLMHLYAESLAASGRENYPDLSENLQMIRAEQNFYDFLLDFFHEYNGMYALWTQEGRYCSALRIEQYADGFLLSGLETAPEARRSGCAAALVKAVLDYLLKTDTDKIYSHVDKRNIPSLSLHQACGFKRILEHAVYIDGSVYHSSCTFCYER